MTESLLDAVVVGAGVAGLTAAYRLLDRTERLRAVTETRATTMTKDGSKNNDGYPTSKSMTKKTELLILEARQRIGGRTFTVPMIANERTEEGFVDLGAAWVWPEAQRSITTLLRLLEREDKLQQQVPAVDASVCAPWIRIPCDVTEREDAWFRAELEGGINKNIEKKTAAINGRRANNARDQTQNEYDDLMDDDVDDMDNDDDDDDDDDGIDPFAEESSDLPSQDEIVRALSSSSHHGTSSATNGNQTTVFGEDMELDRNGRNHGHSGLFPQFEEGDFMHQRPDGSVVRVFAEHHASHEGGHRISRGGAQGLCHRLANQIIRKSNANIVRKDDSLNNNSYNSNEDSIIRLGMQVVAITKLDGEDFLRVKYRNSNSKHVRNCNHENNSSNEDSIHGEELEVKARHVILAVPPALACSSIVFHPPLHPETAAVMHSIPTWMADAAKSIVVFEKPWWREIGLSGFAVSRSGVLGQIHDASSEYFRESNASSTSSSPSSVSASLGALMGFWRVRPDSFASQEERQDAVVAQLKALFGAQVAKSLEAKHLLIHDGNHRSHPQLQQAVQAEMEKIFKVVAYHEMLWSTERLTSPTDDRVHGRVGGEKARIEYGSPALFRHPICSGRVTLAGTEYSRVSGGFLDGAVRSGENAAVRISKEIYDCSASI